MKFKGLLVVLVAAGSVALGELNIKVGDPVSQLLATLGQPRGITKNEESARYTYAAGTFIVKDGKVVSIPEDFEAKVQREQTEKEAVQKKQREHQAFTAEQTAKGLVLYDGQWITPDQKAKLVAAEKTPEQLRAKRIAAEFSVWDGSHRGLTSYIKSSMNDPKSYEHVETTYSDKGDHLLVKTTFRGKNGFGGVVSNWILAKCDLDGHVLEVVLQGP